MPWNKLAARQDKSYFTRKYPLDVFLLFVPENSNAAIGLILPFFATSGELIQPFMNLAVGAELIERYCWN